MFITSLSSKSYLFLSKLFYSCSITVAENSLLEKLKSVDLSSSIDSLVNKLNLKYLNHRSIVLS